MGFEVEVKAPCGRGVEKRLRGLDAKFLGEERQEDVYFNHPSRDFRETDEALRVRSVGGRCFLTYKGPRISGKTKSREEIEVVVGEGIQTILAKLGFRETVIVSKTRRTYRLRNYEVCVDDVKNLGPYIEVESKNIEDEDRISDVMTKLGVPKEACTTKTYLELLEEKK